MSKNREKSPQWRNDAMATMFFLKLDCQEIGKHHSLQTVISCSYFNNMETRERTVQELNKLSHMILGASLTVHTEMGPGLLESIYQRCLIKELMASGVKVESNVGVDLYYKGELLNKKFYLDILVEDSIILELKAVEQILPVHEAQIISYLRITNLRLGFIVNFNVPLLKNGFRRFVNKF